MGCLGGVWRKRRLRSTEAGSSSNASTCSLVATAPGPGVEPCGRVLSMMTRACGCRKRVYPAGSGRHGRRAEASEACGRSQRPMRGRRPPFLRCLDHNRCGSQVSCAYG